MLVWESGSGCYLMTDVDGNTSSWTFLLGCSSSTTVTVTRRSCRPSEDQAEQTGARARN